MFGVQYLKTGPTQYVLHYQSGRIRHKGAGQAFFYYKPSSSIAVVPISSTDAPFIFNEVTSDFQAVTVQGQLTYRITNPEHGGFPSGLHHRPTAPISTTAMTRRSCRSGW
jgi:hypothetical protein